jgi:hypothetical protein
MNMSVLSHLIRFCRVASIFSIALLVSCTSRTYTAEEFEALMEEPDKSLVFEKEKNKVVQRDDSADFDLLRSSFLDTPAYQPWESREHQAGLLILKAHEDDDAPLCLALSKAVLENNFTNLIGHFGNAVCYAAIGNTEKSELHAWILQGLIDSIRASGDGLTVESAYICNSPTEMRDFVRMLGLLMYRQEYVLTGPKQIEKIHAVDTITNENKILFFDTSAARNFSFRS